MSDTTPRLLSEAELAAIRDRADRAEGGPWVTDDGTCHVITDEPAGDDMPLIICALGPGIRTDRPQAGRDSDFIAHARQDVPALLAHVATLEGMLRDCAADEGRGLLLRYRRALEAIDREGGPNESFCERLLGDIARAALNAA